MGDKISWEGYMEWHRPWLDVCDGFLYLRSSKGADIELNMAKELGKTIYYSIIDIPLRKAKNEKNRK